MCFILFLVVLSIFQVVFLEEIDSNSKQLKLQIDKIEENLNKLSINLNTANEEILNIRKTLKQASTSKPLPGNCKEIQENGYNTSGVYSIQPQFSVEPFLVYCDMESQNGGWTLFLNRFNGDQDFYQSWEDYKNGFGNLAEEFWLGLEHLHQLTGFEVNELLVELEDWENKEVYANYELFSVGSENEGYRLELLGEYKGTAGDSLKDHAGMKFSTKDKDQDKYIGGNCASYRGGGWWYKDCVESHLTGKYRKGVTNSKNEYNVMFWEKFHGSGYSLKEARMMVRPKSKN